MGFFLAEIYSDKAKSILVKLKSCKFILKFKILIKRHNHLPLEYNKPQKIPKLPTWLKIFYLLQPYMYFIVHGEN